MESIRRVFGYASRKTKNPLHVTSVKANIGHLEAASGSASLAKLLLMFRHRIIPRLISVNKLNPLIGPLDTDGIALDLEMKPWTLLGSDEEELSRLAVLNNYGAAGSNASLLLEEYEDARGIQEVDNKMPFVLAISGKTVEAVEALRALYIDFLSGSQSTHMRICDITYTATARREIYGYRLAVSGCEALDMVEKLNNASIVRTYSIPTSKVIFVFSGQGNQYLGMGSQLYKTCPLFRNYIDECQSILLSLDFQGMLEMILGQEDDCESTKAEKCEVDQITIFSLEYALSRLWISWGVEPIAVVGHRYEAFPLRMTYAKYALKPWRICSTCHCWCSLPSKRLVSRCQ
jgi:acyl transferase domain-containing protein